MSFRKKKKSKKDKPKLFTSDMTEYFNIHDKYYAGLAPKNYMLTSLGFQLSDYIEAHSKLNADPSADSYTSAAFDVIEIAVARHKTMRSMPC